MTTAIVLAGAGARGAYEAGVLSVLLPLLREQEQEVLLIGTSAGAINTAVLAGTAHLPVREAVEILRAVWCTLSEEDVFDVKYTAGFSYLLEFVTAGASKPRTYGLLDTSPLERTIDHSEFVDWGQLRRNVGDTWVKGAAVVATRIATGTSVVFVQGLRNLPRDNRARGIEYRHADLTGAHIRASAAIPVAFPAVEIDGEGWFADGGTRLNTPIAPATDFLKSLGSAVKRVLIVATHPDPSQPPRSAMPPIPDRPDVIDQAASILHSVFIDRVAEDVRSLRRVNHALEIAGGGPPSSAGDQQPIWHAYFGPPISGLIAQSARDTFAAKYRTWSLKDFSVISRALGGRGTSRNELLSFLFFDPTFLSAVFQLGQEHARAQTKNGISWTLGDPVP
jgi:NTE family protein